MALEIKQQLKLTQHLIMTPQLQQALKILQMPRLDLTDAVQVEVKENPVLEEVLGSPEEEWPAEQEKNGAPSPNKEPPAQPAGIEWERFPSEYSIAPYHDVQRYHSDDDRPSYEQTQSKPQGLSELLIGQLRLTDLDATDRYIGVQIIGNLGSDGYLKTTVEALAEECGVSTERIEYVLKRVQELDPPGIAARDLQECLLIQITLDKMTGSLAEKIVLHHLKELENNKIPQIAKKLGTSIEEVVKAVEYIKSLDPRPGGMYSTDECHYITPDVYVVKLEDDYVIVLNEDGLPKLRISAFYRRSLARKDLAKEDRSYIQDKMKSAVWLIRSIHQRQRTIYRVTESIMRFQREFLDQGIEYLRPLILKDVAADTELSESTISRVVTNKYVHTPRGLYELKFFFNSSIQKRSGEVIASQSVKEQIQKLVQQEDPKKPLSDQEIVELLSKTGIRIARRTVAKYRSMLGVLPSSKRRKLY